MMDRFQQVEVTSRGQWRDWLVAHHHQADSIWLVTYKKHAGNGPDGPVSDHRYLPYDAIVEEALCFGWIDSLPRRLDADRTMLLLSPRRPKSAWSRLNKTRVAHLMDQGLITPAGLAKIEQAKADGSWTFLDDVEALIIPVDLAAALAQNPTAANYFEDFSPSAKKGILQWIKSAKQAATRQKRIAKTVEFAAQNLKANG
jgi:uncharacterized protein YdeI (YjbR/CyaY-like superfamily)